MAQPVEIYRTDKDQDSKPVHVASSTNVDNAMQTVEEIANQDGNDHIHPMKQSRISGGGYYAEGGNADYDIIEQV